MWRNRLFCGFTVLALMFAGIAGCGGQSPGQNLADNQSKSAVGGAPVEGNQGAAAAKPAKAEPVELTLYQSVQVTDDDFRKLFADPVAKKYPNITLKLLRPAAGARVPDLVAAGTAPDIILTYNGGFDSLTELNLQTDITPLLKQNNIDLNRFEPTVLNAMKSDKGEIYALPYGVNFNALYYNKDIFNKFGVAFPKDGMTWEQVVELGKKLTRTDGGIQYYGLDPENLSRVLSPYSIPWVAPGTDTPNLDNDKVIKVFQLVHDIYSIPGNRPKKLNDSANNVAKIFLDEKNIAMFGTVNIFNRIEEAAKQGLDWDLVQYPSHKDKPNTYGAVDAHVMFLSSTSKHKAEAAQVMGVVTSDEVQKISARSTGRLTPLKNADIKKQLGADMPFLKGKNIAGIFKSSPAPVPKQSQYDGGASKIVNEAFQKYMDGQDLNSALREATEKINQNIKQEKAK